MEYTSIQPCFNNIKYFRITFLFYMPIKFVAKVKIYTLATMKRYLFIIFFLSIAFNSYSQIINCFECDVRLLTEADLAGKSLEEIALLRNEIFARKGYVFNNERYQRYFERQSWYKSASSNNVVELSSTETQNVEFMKSIEARLQRKRDAAIRDLILLKKALNNKDNVTIDRFMSELKEHQWVTYGDCLEELRMVLNNLLLEDIHWNKGRAYYSRKIDNGYNISGESIYIQGNTITISRGDYSHSEIFGDFDDGYSDYMSEGEWSEFWIFTMGEDGIKFDSYQVVG
ncbi:YARHG domain-containing protein [Dysgonomonas sp. 25]|nr:YARHG domain-containing protein [Dysgonomonas sp. 25]